jgi:RNase P protein component
MDKKTITLTLYGSKKGINEFSVTLFDTSDCYDDTVAKDYCANINALELKDDNWVYAVIVKENKRTKFRNPETIDFDILCTLDNRSIQTVLQNTGHYEFSKALKSAKKEIFYAVLRNMSKRATRMLLENMEYIGPIRLIDVIEARRKIVEVIQHLEDAGKITIPRIKRAYGGLSQDEIDALLAGN